MDATEHPWAKLSAAIVHKGRIIAIGMNKMKSHPFQARFGKNKDAIFLHAEIAAIKNALRILDAKDLKNTSLYICRVKKEERDRQDWVDGLAKPCPGCLRAIAEFGIKQVVYTTGNEQEYLEL